MIAALASLLLLAGEVDVVAAGIAESRAGTAPVIAGGASQAFVAQVLRPIAELGMQDAGLTLRLDYSPRIFWQDPNPSDTTGPLVLHTANLTITARTLRRLGLTLRANGTLGKPDYTALAQVLGPTQGTIPVVTTIASGTAVGTATVRLSPRADLELRGQLFVWHALDVPDTAATGTVTAQTVVTLEPGATMRLTRRDTLGLRTAVAAAWYSTGARYFTVTPVAAWTLRLTPLDSLLMTLGAAYTSSHGPGVTSPPVAPVGSVDLDAAVARWENVLLRLTAGTALNVFFDPVLGTATPRAIARGGAALAVAPDWAMALRGDFATALPYTTTAGDVTAFSVTAAVRRQLSGYLFVELGGMWGDRGPALDTPDFAFHQRQLWAFFSLTGSTRAPGRAAR